MLRTYCNLNQHAWDEFLSVAEFAYNNTLQASTGQAPFFMNYGHHPNTPAALMVQRLAPTASTAADGFLQRMSTTIGAAQKALMTA